MSDLLTLSKNYGVLKYFFLILENANKPTKGGQNLRVVATRFSSFYFFSLGCKVNYCRGVLRETERSMNLTQPNLDQLSHFL
jgi:tRNA(Ser,Leu) C12 N-acetylase TAN1